MRQVPTGMAKESFSVAARPGLCRYPAGAQARLPTPGSWSREGHPGLPPHGGPCRKIPGFPCGLTAYRKKIFPGTLLSRDCTITIMDPAVINRYIRKTGIPCQEFRERCLAGAQRPDYQDFPGFIFSPSADKPCESMSVSPAQNPISSAGTGWACAPSIRSLSYRGDKGLGRGDRSPGDEVSREMAGIRIPGPVTQIHQDRYRHLYRSVLLSSGAGFFRHDPVRLPGYQNRF